MLQVVNKEAQSLPLAFKVSAAIWVRICFAGQGILGLEQQYFLYYIFSGKKTNAQSSKKNLRNNKR